MNPKGPKILDDARLKEAQAIVYGTMAPTPLYAWPLLGEALGCQLFIKHENHTPTGAFKVRGGLVLMNRLRQTHPELNGIVSATRGNHGQSLAFAARRAGLACVIAVPRGNSAEKNAAMRAFGAELIEAGEDFDAAVAATRSIAEERGYLALPSFHADLVAGVATYAHEFLTGTPEPLDTIYVPIGLGSGICGLIEVRDLLGLPTEIVGVVSEGADAYALSFASGTVTPTNRAHTFADGMAVRTPDPEALAIIRDGAERIIRVSDAAIAEAIRLYFRTIHAAAEGAGAAALAGLMQERDRQAGKRIGVVLSGGNIDSDWFAEVLSGGIPTPS